MIIKLSKKYVGNNRPEFSRKLLEISICLRNVYETVRNVQCALKNI